MSDVPLLPDAGQKLRLKTQLGLFEWAELDRLAYPLRFTAIFEHYATGEGITHGLLLGHASSEVELRGAIVEQWGDYFAVGVFVKAGWVPPKPYASLLSPMAKRAIERVTKVLPGRLIFATTLHVNHA